MIIPHEIQIWLYKNGLSYVFNESILNSPLVFSPIEHYVLHFLVLTLIHVLPNTNYRLIFGLLVSVLHLFYSPFNYLPPGCDNLTVLLHYIAILQLLNYTLNLFFSVPDKTDYRLAQYKINEKGELLYDPARYRPLTRQKLHWAFHRCFGNFRGVGWNFEVSQIRRRPRKENVFRFILLKCILYECLLKFIFYDLANFALILCDLNKELGPLASSTITKIYNLIHHNSFALLLLTTLSSSYCVYYGLNLVYWQTCVFSLFFGLSNVEDWPDQFMIGEGGFTVSSFWSCWWHQLISRDAYMNSKRLFGKVRNPFLRRYLLCVSTFFIAGLIHAFASSQLKSRRSPSHRVHGSSLIEFLCDTQGTFILFLGSAHIIVFEWLLFNQMKKRGLNKLTNLRCLKHTLQLIYIGSVLAIPVYMYIRELYSLGVVFPQFHQDHLSLSQFIY